MRTARLKIDGKLMEGVLMSGGFGAQVYSVSGVRGVVLKIGRRSHVVHEDVPAFKCVMRFVNMKYQPLNEQDAVLAEFRGLVKELKGEETEMAKVKNPCKRNPIKPYSEMSREELEAEKRAALSLLKSLTRGSALYEDTMRALGKINRELKSLGEPSTLTEFSRRRNPAMSKKKYLHLWERPSNYAGPDWSDYYVLFVKSRDDESYDILKLSNFDVALERLGGENEENGVLVIRDRHWAVGWIEYILVHKDSKKVAEAEKIMKEYEAYPVLDDDHYSEARQEYLDDTFKIYAEDFTKELLSFLGDEREVEDIKGKELEQAEIILREIYQDSADGSGEENAFVTEKEIQMWVERTSEYFYDKNNVWYKRLVKHGKKGTR